MAGAVRASLALFYSAQAFGLTFSKPKYTKKPAMPRSRHALFLFGLLASPALASPALDKHLDAMAGATTEQAFFVAAEELLQLGPRAIPDLTERLASAADENTRIDLTFILASIMEQARLQGEAVKPPTGLTDEVASLLLLPADIALEANLVNLAALFGPQPLPVTEGLLALLARAENEGLRATTAAVIATHAELSALPLIYDALRQSPSDTFSGDIALILRGTELPDDIAEIFVTLLASDNPEARQSASLLLDEAGITNPAQLDAALSDLEVATTDMQLLTAAMAVRNHTDRSERVAVALERAMTVASRVEERSEIIRALGASGAVGHAKFAEIIAATSDPEIVRQLSLGALTSPELRKSLVIADAFITLMVTAEDPIIAEEAAFALYHHYRDLARPAIEHMLADEGLSPVSRKRLTAALERQ